MDRITITDKDAKGIVVKSKPNGKEPAKVLSALEEALGDVVMEWEN